LKDEKHENRDRDPVGGPSNSRGRGRVLFARAGMTP